MLTNLAHPLGLPATQNMGTASRFERPQSTAWTHLPGERGNLQTLEDEPIKINRDRLTRSIPDQGTDFMSRTEPKAATPNLPPTRLFTKLAAKAIQQSQGPKQHAMESEATHVWARDPPSSSR